MPDGTVDTGFITGTGADGNVRASCVQSDGAILLGGEFNQFNGVLMYKLVRLDQNGALDPGFTLDPGPNNQVNAVVLQEDGRILIGGIFTEYDDVPRRRVARINGTDFNGVPESRSLSVALSPNLHLISYRCMSRPPNLVWSWKCAIYRQTSAPMFDAQH
ncbi:MAG: delta-60 repeat domain-containing protein [Flavobacteriales bacterium]|nr:delta-60 repeat domain-containing protein [Flavobacteriales bacterium]